MINFDVDYNEEGKIISFLDGNLLVDKPEERVRQRYLKTVHYDYGYAKNQIAIEVPIYYGHDVLKDREGNPVRADIVIYENATACRSRQQGRILLVVECKAPNITKGYDQLVSYIYNTSASGGVWFNGSDTENEVIYYRRQSEPNNILQEWPGIPRKNEGWDSIGRRTKDQLKKPRDIKGLLRRCHNKLHGRGTEEDDLTMDMVRIILAKAMDEEKENELPEFYCTPDEYRSEEGRIAVEERIQGLFNEVKALNNEVFSEHERISVGNRAICEVVSELQDYQLLSDISDAQEWDLMGYAYEEYTETYLKRKSGQFFTNRLVVDFLVSSINPTSTDIILDPAGGSGGFLTGAMRFVRNKILQGRGSNISKQRQLDRFRTRLFLVESSKRLVKVAKTSMILNGDGHAGMTQGDSLGDYTNFDSTILAQCNSGVPTVILTNPPFAGVGEGRITDIETLERFQTARRWIYSEDENKYLPTNELLTDGAPPEMLFLERCIDWLSPGGKLGIVLPKGFLDTNTYLPGRQYLFDHCKLLAVVNLHKNTFQPHTGVRTCLLIIEKKSNEELPVDYPIFMAISRKIGQDSEGVPVYKRDHAGNLTDELDHDLEEILESYNEHKNNTLQNSEYYFSINKSDIDGSLKLNPQKFMPHLNETLRKVAQVEDIPNWSVVTLGTIDNDIQIFKGPRFKSENLIIEDITEEQLAEPLVEPYYTPSAILQDRSDSIKYLDLSQASERQLDMIGKLRVKRGDLLISRSGTVGRVSLVTNQHDNAIVSDDLIRVIIPDEDIRYYVYHYLLSKYAQDQFKMNEYGTIQQHLEPAHVRETLVPLPDDIEQVREIINQSKRSIRAKEIAYERNLNALNAVETTLYPLLNFEE
ncbi:N-6 DNA methylase [Oceanobacillus sp. M65]|uniref:N-6 DNA methylase n=1 Tax=Oceanobacillus sp. M65 TaxID=3457435 RepID=UPI003FCD8EB9